ncbi:MAG: Ku protein [Kofleriaceae bacterium]|nr:Ku protein [Kofleriaceae bacterium]MCL4224704.1 Ku protein [Myxococcales bacterium]
MPARAIGTATISFGLVSIPIKLYTTSESGSDISFNMLHAACGSRLKQQYICSKDGEVVERDQTVKGYEFAKGQYVTFSPEELKTLDAVATNSIELVEFVPARAVDPLLFEKSYYVGPDKGGERAYKLLAESMTQSGLIGIASYSARGKQYVVAVRPFQNGLIVHQLRYADEVKAWSEVPMPDLPELKPSELALAQQLIAQITHETFDPQQYKDDVKARMMELIQAKVDGQEITAAPEAPQGKIIDLMEALKASLGMSGATLPARAAEPAPAADAAPAAAPEKKKASRKKSA